MRFYYLSLISWTAYAFVAIIAIVFFSLLWRKAFTLKFTNPVYWVLVAAILIGPWVEELSIAYNFDRVCRKDAGVFVNKVVQADGYYDDTGGGSLDLIRAGTYRFIESRNRQSYIRLTLGDSELMRRAFEQFQRTTGKDPSIEEVIKASVDEQTEALVFPKRGEAWRITKIDKPTARYEFKRLDFNTPVSHQIRRFEDVVIDRQNGEVLGRYTNYHRGPYWFFISLDLPTIPCRETEVGTGKYGSLIYLAVLKPSK